MLSCSDIGCFCCFKVVEIFIGMDVELIVDVIEGDWLKIKLKDLFGVEFVWILLVVGIEGLVWVGCLFVLIIDFLIIDGILDKWE